MLGGVCVLLTMLVSINGALNVVWGKGTDWFYNALILFFITPALLGSYICRALRLAVVFHPKAKRALPWLIPVCSKECRASGPLRAFFPWLFFFLAFQQALFRVWAGLPS